MNTMTSPLLTTQPLVDTNLANQSYTDLNQLQSIKTQDEDTALKQVAKQFESFFLQMVMKSMRSANKVFSEGNFLQSNETEFHQDMYDKQMTLSLSNGKGSGLSDMLYQQMKKSYLHDAGRIPEPLEGPIERSSSLPVNYFKEGYETVKEGYESVKKGFETAKNTVATIASDFVKNVGSPKEFVEFIKPFADKVADLMGVDPKVIIAQAALETGWGKHVIKDSQGLSSLNLFNIKTGSSWEGKSVGVSTLEYHNGVAAKEKATFRRYDSLEDSFMDFYQLLQKNRYSKVMANVDNPETFLRELQSAGYATDPQYANKILSIVNSNVFSE